MVGRKTRGKAARAKPGRSPAKRKSAKKEAIKKAAPKKVAKEKSGRQEIRMASWPLRGKVGRRVSRIRTGIRGLDNLIGGGFVKNSAVLVRGNTGTAKTLFCLNYLYTGAKKYGEPGVFITLSETEESIVQHGHNFNWDIDKLIKDNMLSIIRLQPHDMANIVKAGRGSLTDTIDSLGAKRLVIDSLNAYELIFENEYKSTTSLQGLFEFVKQNDVTSVVTSESPVTPLTETKEKLGYMTDTIINLYSVRERTNKYRALEVVKMRHTDHDNRISRFSIDKHGLKIHSKGRRR